MKERTFLILAVTFLKHNLDFSAIEIIFSHQPLWRVNTSAKVKLRDFYVFSCLMRIVRSPSEEELDPEHVVGHDE